MTVYFLKGPVAEELIQEACQHFGVQVEERFGSQGINMEVVFEEREDDFTDWMEARGIEFELV